MMTVDTDDNNRNEDHMDQDDLIHSTTTESELEKHEDNLQGWMEHTCGAPMHRGRCQRCKDYILHLNPDNEAFKEFVLRKRILEMDKAMKTLTTKTEKLQTDIRCLEDSVKKERALMRKYKAERNALQDELDEIKAELEDALDDVDHYQDDIADLERDSATFKKRYQLLGELITKATSTSTTEPNVDTTNVSTDVVTNSNLDDRDTVVTEAGVPLSE
ncbi:hypothetical protein QCA50_008501 [Cerrena zonata]|uniref:Uncharacterized protein n=1 Tax=Cerrena zonata TaxID=2478898 RepID=A0AAW0G490_9APHY